MEKGLNKSRGNLQYISVRNLSENKKTALFLIDYANRQRLKLFAETEVKDAAEVPELINQLSVENHEAKIERAVILHVKAFNWNCPQHITPRFTMDQVKIMTQPLNN